jgi:hypothetical protein
MKCHLKQTGITRTATGLLFLLFYFSIHAQEQSEHCEQLCGDFGTAASEASARETDSSLLLYEEKWRIDLSGTRCNGITVGMNGCMYAAGKNVLIIFESNGMPRKRVDLQGKATCIASDERGFLYLGMAEHVEVYDADGELRDIWVSLGSNAVITSIAVSSDLVYVADAGNRLVMGFSKSGRLETIIGEGNQGAPGFIIPSPYFDVAVGPDNTLWAANTGRRLLENYTPDGTMISSWGESSVSMEGFCGCCNPSHFAILQNGSFVTSEKGIPRVKLYDPLGQFAGVVSGPDQFKAGTVGIDIAVTQQGEILLLDPVMGCIRVFNRK